MQQSLNSKTSNPFSSILSEEDAASIAALRSRMRHCQKYGQKELAWQLSVRESEIVNRAMLKKLRTGNFDGDDEFFFIETPDEYPAEENDGIDLQLFLVKGSPLAQKIMVLLEEEVKRGSIV